jgi:topoisomerase-4 subunit A
MKTQEAVYDSVKTGFVPFAKELIRPIVEEDIQRLLEIPIRRISLYDISKNRQEVEAINKRLKEIKHHLSHLTDYALAFLDDVLKKPQAQVPRLTQSASFKRLAAKDVALRDKKLRYDKATGYLGWGLSSGDVQLEVSELDKVLLIQKDLKYTVVRVPEKKFVGKGILGIYDADKDALEKVVFSVLYKETSNGNFYIKRFQIEGYILDKDYEILSEGSQFIKMTTRENAAVQLEYKQKSLMGDDPIPLSQYPIRGVKAGGVRVSNRIVNGVKFVRAGTAGDVQEAE